MTVLVSIRRVIIEALKRLLLGITIIVKFALFLPILVYMVWFSYKVDRSGLFKGDLAPRQVVNLLLEKKDVTNYEQMDERQIVRLYTLLLPQEETPYAVGVGSSRVLQVTEEVADCESFFNLGVTGADIRDVMTSYYLCVKEGKIPKVLLWSVDPWVLYGSEDAYDKRADADLYDEFLQNVVGIDTGYEEQDQVELWKALVDPAYFQGNREYYYRTREGNVTDENGDEIAFREVDGDPYVQYESIKRSDGSVLYDYYFRHQTQDEILLSAIAQSSTFSSIHMEGFTEISKDQEQIIEAFVNYARSNGTEVIMLLSPFHPFLYDAILAECDKYSGFFATETWFKSFAKKNNIPLYGSYDPLLIDDMTEMDFYDGVHCTSDMISRFFPGIDKAMADHAAGKTCKAYSQKHRTTAEERVPW